MHCVQAMQPNNNKQSKNFDEKPHHHLVTPHGVEWICLTLNPSNTRFLGLTWVSPPNGISIGSAVFAYTAAKGRQPSKITHPLGDRDPQLIHGSLGPPSQSSNGISIGSAVFAGLMNVTNRQTDRHTPGYSMCSNKSLSLAAIRCDPVINL